MAQMPPQLETLFNKNKYYNHNHFDLKTADLKSLKEDDIQNVFAFSTVQLTF